MDNQDCIGKLLRATVNWVSNIIWDCSGFPQFRYMIGPENSCHFDYQSDSKLKPSATWLLAFPALQVVCFSFVFFFYYEGGFLAIIGCWKRSIPVHQNQTKLKSFWKATQGSTPDNSKGLGAFLLNISPVGFFSLRNEDLKRIKQASRQLSKEKQTLIYGQTERRTKTNPANKR